jgi:integrase
MSSGTAKGSAIQARRTLSGDQAISRKGGTKAAQDFHRFRFHDLRHLFAVEYLRASGDRYTISR